MSLFPLSIPMYFLHVPIYSHQKSYMLTNIPYIPLYIPQCIYSHIWLMIHQSFTKRNKGERLPRTRLRTAERRGRTPPASAPCWANASIRAPIRARSGQNIYILHTIWCIYLYIHVYSTYSIYIYMHILIIYSYTMHIQYAYMYVYIYIYVIWICMVKSQNWWSCPCTLK